MRLEVSRKADLATRVLVELSRAGGRTKAAELAARVGTTTGYLSQVVAPLIEQGWVRSEPGPTGGYAADAAPKDVSVLDVVEAVEGPTDTGRCVVADRACADGGLCALHVPWSRARAALVAELEVIPVLSRSTA